MQRPDVRFAYINRVTLPPFKIVASGTVQDLLHKTIAKLAEKLSGFEAEDREFHTVAH